MASRRRSEDFSRKGSMLRVREVKFGAKGEGWCGRVLREGGIVGGLEVGGEGRVCRNEVRKWELWIVRGSSSKMSW